jgi:outer membrane receptor protein involved in Fe transport
MDGTELSGAPQTSWTALVSQDIEVGEGTLTLMANASYTGERHNETLLVGQDSFNRLKILEDYTIVNTSAVYRFGADEEYSIGAYVNNVTDEHFCGDSRADDGGANLADRAAFPPNPALTFALQYAVSCSVTNASTRTYGVTFGYEF